MKKRFRSDLWKSINKTKELEKEIDCAKKYLATLLVSVYPEIEPLDTLDGLISQVGNGFAVPLKNK